MEENRKKPNLALFSCLIVHLRTRIIKPLLKQGSLGENVGKKTVCSKSHLNRKQKNTHKTSNEQKVKKTNIELKISF